MSENDNEVLRVKNKKGYSVEERIEQDIEYAKNSVDQADRTLLATKVLGAADLAVEFGLITYTQWELYISDIFNIL